MLANKHTCTHTHRHTHTHTQIQRDRGRDRERNRERDKEIKRGIFFHICVPISCLHFSDPMHFTSACCCPFCQGKRIEPKVWHHIENKVIMCVKSGTINPYFDFRHSQPLLACGLALRCKLTRCIFAYPCLFEPWRFLMGLDCFPASQGTL